MNANEITNSFYSQNCTRFTTILPNTYPGGWWECDILAVTKALFMYEYEIKVSVSDFKADAKKGGEMSWGQGGRVRLQTKHEKLAAGDKKGPSNFWFIVPDNLIAVEDIPDFAGLIYAVDGNHGVRLIEQKKAPRLHKHKMERIELDRIRRNLYWRYWNLRLKHERVTT